MSMTSNTQHHGDGVTQSEDRVENVAALIGEENKWNKGNGK